MSTAVTLADLLERLGDIPPHRIRADPPPGTGTEKDVLSIRAREKRLYELVDGVLVEKIMGFPESALACDLIKQLGYFLDEHDLGMLGAPDGTLRLMPGLVRIPDISFVSWDQLPSRLYPTKPIPDLFPDLAVEILSEGNTRKEIERKLREYFLSGTRLVWVVDLKKRIVEVFTAPDRSVVFTEDQTLDGGDVLPGLALPLRKVFARVPHVSAKPARQGKARRPASRKRKNGKPS